MAPKRSAIALHDLVSAVQQAALHQQVSCHESDITANGVRLLLVGGAPDSTGTDEDRVLLAARAAIEHEGPLSVRVGINRGRVFSGILGPPYRQTFSIKGDAVNLAARVMGRAAPGQVLATAAVLERARVPFASSPLEPFAVKGKSELVEASILGPVERAPSRRRSPERSPLIGRETEMRALGGVLEDALRGEGGVVDVVGEPGIGKSRLVAEVRDRAADFRVLHFDCEEYEASTPYLAVGHLLRQALELEDADSDETGARLAAATESAAPELMPWLPLIGVALGLELAPTVQTSELGDAVRRVRLERTASALLVRLLSGPVLLIVEDAHWLDEASAGVLRQVAARIRDERWALCMTRRAAPTGIDAPSWPATLTLRLAPLAAEAVPAFIQASVPDLHLARHEIAAVTERAGGNPLFLRELLLNARAGDADGEVPDSVEALIAAQIDRLPARHRRLLRCVSVLGQTFSLELAAAVAGDDLDGTRRVACARRVPGAIRRAANLRFTHALLRDVAYEGLPFRRRRDLHGRAGAAIVQRAGRRHIDDQAELLSLHFFHAQRYEDAWHYSLRAAASARTKWANAEAAEFYGRALLASRHLPQLDPADVASAAEALGDVNERLGKFGEATVAYTRARRLIGGRRDDQARLLMKEGVIREHSGRYPQALRWYTRALAMDDPARPLPNRAEVLIAYAGVRFRQGRFREAVRWCERPWTTRRPSATAAGARARLLRPPHPAHDARDAGEGRVPDTGAAYLRRARRPDAAGLRAEQPRHRCLRGGRVGRGDQPLPPEPRGTRARRRMGRGRGHRPQHRRDPRGPGPSRGGGAARPREPPHAPRRGVPDGHRLLDSSISAGSRLALAGRAAGNCWPTRSTSGARSAARPSRSRPRRSWPRRCCSTATTRRRSSCSTRRSSGSGTSPSYRGCGRCSGGSSAARWGRR